MLGLRREIDRDFNLAEGAERLVRRALDRIPVRGERKLHPARRELSYDLRVVRVETVLAGPEVDRAHGKTLAGGRDLLERELIDAPGVPVAVGALQVAGIREADAER